MSKIIDAPRWIVSLLTPFIAKQLATQLAREHPDWGPEEIAARLRADLGRGDLRAHPKERHRLR